MSRFLGTFFIIMKKQDKIMQQSREYNLTYGVTHTYIFNKGFEILMPAFFCEENEHIFPRTSEEEYLLDFFFAIYQFDMEQINYNEMCIDILIIISSCLNTTLAKNINDLFQGFLKVNSERKKIRNFIKLINLSTYKRPVRNGEIAC